MLPDLKLIDDMTLVSLREERLIKLNLNSVWLSDDA